MSKLALTIRLEVRNEPPTQAQLSAWNRLWDSLIEQAKAEAIKAQGQKGARRDHNIGYKA